MNWLMESDYSQVVSAESLEYALNQVRMAPPPFSSMNRDLKLQLRKGATGSRADNAGCHDPDFCHRRLARYDRPYRLQERCNQGESCLQAPGATRADREKWQRAGHSW